MTTPRLRNMTFTIAGALACLPSAAFAKAVGSVAVERIDTESTGSDRAIIIRTSKEPTFSVFRLSDPFRVLVDINDARLPSGIDLMKVSDGLIRYVSTNSFADELSAIVRVEIALEANAEYRVKAEGRSIVVRITGPASNSDTSSNPEEASSFRDTPSGPQGERASSGREAGARSADHVDIGSSVGAVQAPSTSSVRLSRITKRVERSRTVLVTKVQGGSVSNGAIRIEEVADPARLVVDIRGATTEPKWQKIDVKKLGVRRARVGTSDEGVRVVLDLEEGKPVPRVDVEAVADRLEIALSKAKEATSSASKAPPSPTGAAHDAPAILPELSPEVGEKIATGAAISAPPTASAPPTENPAARVTDVRFEPRDGFVRLTVVLDGETGSLAKDSTSRPEAPTLRLANTEIPHLFERTLDVSQVAGDIVQAISTYRDGRDTILSASVGPSTEHRHWRKGNRLMWDFRTALAAATPSHDTTTRVLSYPEQSTSGYSTPAIQTTASLLPQAQRYKGRRISLDLKDADIQNVLRLLADVSKLNIVAADDVKGKVTIKLRNVPWDQALDIILRAKQLDKTRSGNIIRVAPIEILRKEEELRIERAKARIELEPLSVRLIPVSYAIASEVRPQVTALLSPRGKVNIDTRTNVLVVEDIAEVLLKVERLVRTLDTQTPQVLIEARIVEANTAFSRELGIQWGGQASLTQQFGTSTGLAFPNNIRISGAADDNNNVTEGVLADPNYAVNLPAASGAGNGGALGFIFGSAGGSALVSLRLTAAESTGKVKIISAPKIVTLDNKQAKILSGEKIPITVITANGPSTRFIDANIELGVTPHVTQDGSILLTVDAKKNELSGRRDLLGTPGVITKEATTEMLVRDGDTAVLGGLYRRTATDNKSYVPWIGQIPVLGWIFKSTRKLDSREELLIFVSPRIVNRSQALVSAQ